MPPGQLQLALNQHVIDGCLDPWHLMPALRLNDVLKMHTEFSEFVAELDELRAGDEQCRL